MQNYQFKVVLLGEGCVGKTSLMLRFVHDQFNDKHLSTIQASFLRKKIKIGNKTVELAIWDTAGQEKYHALGPIYYRGSNGAFLVYDITDVDSFKRIKNWVKELKQSLGDECVLCIVGNKADLEKDRQIPIDEAESYARSVGAKHYSTSAKNNQGVTELFLSISKEMLEKAAIQEGGQGEENGAATSSGGSNKRNVVRVVEDDQAEIQNKKSSCC